MKKNSLLIPINFDKKIILLSDITYYDNSNLPIHFRYQIDIISDTIFTDMIKTISENYPNFKFWWLEGHEAGIKLWERSDIQKIIHIFKKINLSDKFTIIDNNIGESDYDTSYEQFRIGVPGMIGFTSHKGFEISERTFEKKFICLNRIPKPHRRTIFRFLKSNYLDDSYLSFGPTHVNDSDTMVFDTTKNMEHLNLFSAWPHEAQKTSFCNIVTESLWWSGPIHITEKTDKCFSAGQPFVLVAGSGYLKKLKELGFKTFDKWWDESYDDEIDDDIRINKVKETINFIGKLSIAQCEKIYKEMIPILKHNKQLSIDLDDDIYKNYKWDNYESILFNPKKSVF